MPPLVSTIATANAPPTHAPADLRATLTASHARGGLVTCARGAAVALLLGLRMLRGNDGTLGKQSFMLSTTAL